MSGSRRGSGRRVPVVSGIPGQAEGGSARTALASAEPEPEAGPEEQPEPRTEPRSEPEQAPAPEAAPEPEEPPAPRRAPRWRLRLRECGLALRRTPVSIWNRDVTDWAAALTYYAVLAIFPALLVTVSTVGIAGPAATREVIRHIPTVLPAQSGQLVSGVLSDMAGQNTTAWLLAAFGTVGALWSSSSYLNVFRRALHSMLGVKDRRPVWRRLPITVLTAMALLALLVSSVFLLVLSGELVRRAGGLLGVGGALATAWESMKWPLLICLVTVLVLGLYRAGPWEMRRLRHHVLGAVLAVGLWLAVGAGFAFYAAHVPTYHRLYGSLAGIVVFLVWLWLSNLALLCGAQFNAELAVLRAEREGGSEQA